MNLEELMVTLKMLNIYYYYPQDIDRIFIYKSCFKEKELEELVLDVILKNDFEVTQINYGDEKYVYQIQKIGGK
jgi:hypothetical protein